METAPGDLSWTGWSMRIVGHWRPWLVALAIAAPLRIVRE
jgi:hypothetical protein